LESAPAGNVYLFQEVLELKSVIKNLMMTKTEIKILGDNKIIGYQRFVLVVGMLIVLIFLIISFHY
jgi:hypothetical protein